MRLIPPVSAVPNEEVTITSQVNSGDELDSAQIVNLFGSAIRDGNYLTVPLMRLKSVSPA